MKRDMDLIRQILLRIEEFPSAIDIVPMNNFQESQKNGRGTISTLPT